MLTDAEMKSQQKRCMVKMLTNGEMKSQQKRCMVKMLTDGEMKSQQNSHCGENADRWRDEKSAKVLLWEKC